MTRPVVVQFAKASGPYPKGAEVGVQSAAVAKRVYPDATIVRYQDGDPYEAPKPAKSPAKDPKPDSDATS